MEKTKEQIEQQKLSKYLVRQFRQACVDYGLIRDGDFILVGLSGGKDSLALVELLGMQQKIYVPRFRIKAVHVSVENIGYKSDVDYLNAFCREHGVDFEHITTHYDETTTADSTSLHKQKTHCFLCSWYRRKALLDMAADEGANKIALGHNRDDIVQTLLMNLIYQGSFSTMPPLLQMNKFDMQVIRPLCLIDEAKLQRYAQLCEYRKVPKLCPFEKESSRADIKQLIAQLEQLNPNIRDSVWKAMQNIKTDYLPVLIDK